MTFQDIYENEKQKVRYLTRLAIGLLIIILTQLIIYGTKISDISLYYPPDLRSGAVMKAGEIPPSQVFLFAQYIVQQLNNWDTNGADDYPRNISRLRFYLTPRYSQQLKDAIDELPSGELRDRIRVFKPARNDVYEEKDVVPMGDSWLVWLDINITETVLGQPVKDIALRYPIRVVRHDTNREMNPWQLALDGNSGFDAQRISDL
ncbi:MAG: PFL_4703 family integrating conjugative element protein [Candidatus Thiodiazotropha endolucinida]